ncbi:hypothetical protein EE612_052390 [Oryza sativa]|nr:hypothetical protein EE612_052390 [Oryza sativa]
MNLVRISCLESYCTQKVHLNFKCLITHKNGWTIGHIR